MMKVGIPRFPGTNCDFDIFQWMKWKDHDPHFLWHLESFDISKFDLLILPGGFSYGDYLRSGALAALSPVMNSVKEFANQGKPVLGICNGFQILCEAGLLPGALVQNEGQRFIDDWSEVVVENPRPGFSEKKGQCYRFPIAHGDGRYYAPAPELEKMESKGLVWMRYQKNPNGSLHDIAGVMNEKRNVFGLMPHPERALFDWMGSRDGWVFL